MGDHYKQLSDTDHMLSCIDDRLGEMRASIEKICRKERALERALAELVEAVGAGPGGHDPATVSALQEARAVLRKKDWR